MGAPATYLLNIKDITYVSGTVEMTVQLGQYMAQSYQDTASVSNELLSDITVPACFAATILSLLVNTGTTVYVPFYGDSFLKSATCTEGFQYAISYMHINVINTHATKAATIVATGQYSHNGNDWYDSSYQSVCHVTDRYGITEFTGGDFWNELTAQFTIPGNVDPVAVWTRWKLYSEAGGADVYVHDYTISMEIVPRHTHTWQQVGQVPSTLQGVQVDDASQVGATPQTITCAINGGAPFAITCASPSFANNLDIKPQLVTGVNTIVFTSTTKCCVTPSATLLALPT